MAILPSSLTLRRTYQDSDDHWSISCDGVEVGSIFIPGGRPEPIWQWSNTVQWPTPDIGKNGQAETREECMTQFRAAWEPYRAEIGDDRWQWHVRHMAEVEARADKWRRRRAGEEPGGY